MKYDYAQETGNATADEITQLSTKLTELQNNYNTAVHGFSTENNNNPLMITIPVNCTSEDNC